MAHDQRAEIQHPVLRLPYEHHGGTRWSEWYPPLCREGHALVAGNCSLTWLGPCFRRVLCWTCRADPAVELDTWFVVYPVWDRERRCWGGWPDGS